MQSNRTFVELELTDNEDTRLRLAAAKQGVPLVDFILTETDRYARECEPQTFLAVHPLVRV